MRKNFASRALGVIPFFLLLGSSCSLVYDLNPDQCSTNTDCEGRFGQGYVCDLGLCKCDDASCMAASGDAGSSGKGGKGGSSGATAGSGVGDDGGMGGEPAPTGGTSGTAGTAGTGGSAPVGECELHNDCFKLYPDDSEENPRACVNGTCVPLKSPDCPIVLPLSDNPDPDNPAAGSWNLLKSSDAIILGAFSPITGTSLDTYGRNYDLPVTEFSDSNGGVYTSSNQRRQIVVVMCNMSYNTQDKLIAPAMHLMEDLKVPAVAATLLLKDQRYVWENVAGPRNVFMMMPLYSTQDLVDEPDDGLIWHMLSGANALSVSYQPLLDMTVSHLKTLGDVGDAEDVKIAHVHARDEPFLQDTSNYLESNLEFNGKSVDANGTDGNFTSIQVTSSYSAPGDKQEDAIERILAFGPHVVIGTTVREIITAIIPGVEKDWDTRNPGRERPFYVLGALDYNDAGMPQLISDDKSTTAGKTPLFQRILGVNWPAAADQTVYEAYQQRYSAVYTKREDGYENFYDAMYYLLYGIAGTGYPVTGKRLVLGMQRVTQSGTKIPQVDIGPNQAAHDAVTKLGKESGAAYEMIGAMGPPSWDPSGARLDPASVWCVNALGTYRPDQLRYDASDSTLQPSDTTIVGSDISCFPFPAQ